MSNLCDNHITTITTLVTRSTHTSPRRRSCTMSLFASIIVGNSHQCAEVWTSTVKVTSTIETRVYGCGMLLAVSPPSLIYLFRPATAE